MASGLSSAAAINAVYVIDSIVWNQRRYLPLELDKDLTNAIHKMQKLSKQRQLIADTTATALDVLISDSTASAGICFKIGYARL